MTDRVLVRPRFAMWLKWHTPVAFQIGPLWMWCLTRVDEWHEE